MNQSEQIAALTQLLVWLHVESADPTADESIGKLAKLCGTTPAMVRAWEAGKLRPTTTQAIAWLTALHSKV